MAFKSLNCLIRQLKANASNIVFDSCAPAHFDLSVCPSMSLASPRLRSLAPARLDRFPRGPAVAGSLIPSAPLMRSLPRDLSVTLTDLTVHLARSHGSILSQVFH